MLPQRTHRGIMLFGKRFTRFPASDSPGMLPDVEIVLPFARRRQNSIDDLESMRLKSGLEIINSAFGVFRNLYFTNYQSVSPGRKSRLSAIPFDFIPSDDKFTAIRFTFKFYRSGDTDPRCERFRQTFNSRLEINYRLSAIYILACKKQGFTAPRRIFCGENHATRKKSSTQKQHLAKISSHNHNPLYNIRKKAKKKLYPPSEASPRSGCPSRGAA